MSKVIPRTGPIDTRLVSVKHAAEAVGLSNWLIYQLLDQGEIECRYYGTRRLVVVKSLDEWWKSLPTERQTEVESA